MPNDEQNGSKIAYDEIAPFVGASVLKNKKVYNLSGSFTDSIPLIGKDSSSKGIKISKGEEGLIIDINIIVEYEAKIPQLAWELQSAVKNEIESETEQKVSAVNIHVQGVHLPGEEEE